MASFNQYRRALSVPNGNPNTWHANTDIPGGGGYQPGEVGAVLPWYGQQYQRVKMDSGATSATATGVPAAGQLAFWKDRSSYLVTNDVRFADSGSVPAGQYPRDGRGAVAGVIEMAVLAGEQFFVHQKGASNVKTTSSPAPGDTFIANSGTAADATTTAAGSAPAGLALGVVTSSTKTGGLIPGVLNIEFID